MKLSVIIVTMLLGVCHVNAHDIYSDVKDRHGNSCCNSQDCQPARYRVTKDGVRMLIKGQWLIISKDVIQYRTLDGDTGETGGGHWCGVLEWSVTYCAILP